MAPVFGHDVANRFARGWGVGGGRTDLGVDRGRLGRVLGVVEWDCDFGFGGVWLLLVEATIGVCGVGVVGSGGRKAGSVCSGVVV